MNMLYYLAYGSNLHPLRLTVRVPSARFLGLTKLSGYELRFHKRHEPDASGKCNMYQTGQETDTVIGAIYAMQASEKPLLDRCEGPGYLCDTMRVDYAGKPHDCFVYIAEDSHIDDELVPYCWYKNIVLLGAEYHCMPQPYLAQIRGVPVTRDPDEARHRLHYDLIDQMKNYQESE